MTENSSRYREEHMPHTDGGRCVEEIAGSPATIRERSVEITELAELMKRAARTLELFADGTVGKGESFAAIREQAGEVHDDLSVAADRYLPSGEALATYASALTTAQNATGWRVSGAEREWIEVQERSRALLTAQNEQDAFDSDAERLPDGEEMAGSRPSVGYEQSQFDSAVADWEAYWGGYDEPTETFELAYNAAVTSLADVNKNGVSDGFWDDMMPFVELMLDVLFVLGIALLVVAFFVTGPLALLAGVLATVAGVLSLLGELAKMAAGRGDWTSVALAAVGIIPFGKLAKLGNLAEFASVGARFPKLSGLFRLGVDEFSSYSRALDSFLGSRMPTLFNQFDEAGELIFRTPHGTNTRNMFRSFFTAPFLAQGNAWVGSIRGGWQALAGNPTTLGQALGGAADVYTDLLGTLYEVKGRVG